MINADEEENENENLRKAYEEKGGAPCSFLYYGRYRIFAFDPPMLACCSEPGASILAFLGISNCHHIPFGM